MAASEELKELLARLKEIPMEYFLEEYGYVKNDKSSTKKQSVYQKGKETIVVKRSNDKVTGSPVYTFFSDSYYSGTVVDFLMNKGMDFKSIMHNYNQKNISYVENIDNQGMIVSENINIGDIGENQIKVGQQKYNRYVPVHKVNMDDVGIIREMGINQGMLNKLSQNGFIKRSSFSLAFPFYGYSGKNNLTLCGIYHHRIKQQEEADYGKDKFFQKESIRGLGIMTQNINNKNVFICEQPIDALANMELMRRQGKPVKDVTYIITGGSVGEVFLGEFDKFCIDKGVRHIYYGLDEDGKGEAFKNRIVERMQKHPGITSSVLTPRFKDWENELLQQNILEKRTALKMTLFQYVKTLDPVLNERELKSIVECNREDKDARQAAIQRILDLDILVKLDKKEKEGTKEKDAIKEQKEFLAEVKSPKLTYDKIRRLDSFEKLVEIALKDKDPFARFCAVCNIDDDKTLKYIAKNDKSRKVCMVAMDGVKGKEAIVEVELLGKDKKVSNQAEKRINKEERFRSIKKERGNEELER